MSKAKFNKPRKAAKFVFRPGARLPAGLNAQAAGEALADLYARDGDLRPARMVDVARNSQHPLHVAFEWKDSVAAAHHRLWQARHLIRSVEIVVVSKSDDGGTVTTQMPVYVHVPQPDGKNRYGAIDDVIERPEQLAAALAALQAKRDSLEQFVEHLNRRILASPGFESRGAALRVALESLAACKLALQQAAA